jgi:uncharacterized membrane protein
MKGKKISAAAAALLGLGCMLVGLFVLTGDAQKNISGLCTGFGAAGFALGLGNFILLIAVPKETREEQERIKNIEVNDERNIRIRDKAGAMTNRIVFYALCAAELAFGLLGDLRAVLVLTGIILLEFVLVIVLSQRYSKQM